MILITGAHGMLGKYISEQFEKDQISSLGIHPDCDYRVDLTREYPDFNGKDFETVIHAAGSENEKDAMSLNLEGTKRLISGFKDKLPAHFVYISSFKVYSSEAGEGVTEDTNTWASDVVGKSKALAEEYLREWAIKNEITLSIIRPARMFGNGVKGESLELFNDALSGKYIHVRGNDAMVSLVCALDVAEAVKLVYKLGGIYNAADPYPVKFIDMVEALTANAGAKKRMTHLPAPWAEWIWRLGRWIPSINRNLSPKTVEQRMKTLTLDGSYLSSKTGLKYHNTIDVIERRDQSYPYQID